MVDILNHIFALCYSDRVRTAWIWLREKVIKMMSDQGPAPDLSNTAPVHLPQMQEGGRGHLPPQHIQGAG